MQERRYDASRGMSLLVEDWVSRASALQRKGRAGRSSSINMHDPSCILMVLYSSEYCVVLIFYDAQALNICCECRASAPRAVLWAVHAPAMRAAHAQVPGQPLCCFHQPCSDSLDRVVAMRCLMAAHLTQYCTTVCQILSGVACMHRAAHCLCE